MSLTRDDLLFSQEGLKDLAQAIGVPTAQLWVNPETGTLSLKYIDDDEDDEYFSRQPHHQIQP